MTTDTKPDGTPTVWTYFEAKTAKFKDALTPQKMMLFVILVVAFVQGVISLADLSVSYLYKDDYHMSPAEVAVAQGITGLPWIIKPVWGMISDNIPLFGYRRKSYLLCGGILAAMCYFLLSTFTTTAYFGVCLLLSASVCGAFNSVIAEALIVESAQNNNKREDLTEEDRQSAASNNVSFFFGVKSIGVLISAYAGGWLLGYVSKYTVFYITMMFPLIAGLSSWLLPEKKIRKANANAPRDIEIVAHSPTSSDASEQNHYAHEETRFLNEDHESEVPVNNATENWSKITTFISNPLIYKPVVFIFIFCITPSTGSAMFFYYTNQLGFTTEFMGEIQLASALASILGIWIFNRYFKNTSFIKIFVWSAIICTIANLSQIVLVTGFNRQFGISDKMFCLTGNLLIQVFAELNIIPVLVLACRLCPKNVEGTMYALLMAILNLGSMISNELGAFNTWALGITETNFTNLWILILIASLTTVLPLPFIGMIDFDEAVKMSEAKERNSVLTPEERDRIRATISEKQEEIEAQDKPVYSTI
jgi:folate/biopterin transporter